MSARLGFRLFTGPTLERYFDRVPVDAYELCRHLSENVIGNDGVKLEEELRKTFCLVPAQLTTVISLTVEAHPTVRTIVDGSERWGCLASARVPCRGNKEFLRTSIAPDFRPRFRGRFTKNAVHLITVLPSPDLTGFRDQALEEVLRTNEALDAFRPIAHAYDERLADEIKRILRSF